METKTPYQRKPISVKLRFEIFKRDGFTCQYCNRTPPKVTLEVDHIIPVVNGGKNNQDNLITACFECNRGKAGTELTQVSETLQEKSERIKEKEKQYLAFKKLQESINLRIQHEIEHVSDIFSETFKPMQLTDNFKQGSLKKFVVSLGAIDVSDAMHTACGKINHAEGAVKYFCGICWNLIKNPE